MKKFNKIWIACLLTFVLTLSFNIEATSANKNEIPKQVRMMYENGQHDIEIKLGDIKHSIKNVKSNKKDLVAIITQSTYIRQESEYSGNEYENKYYIGLKGKKEGTYTVSFDIVNSKGKKLSTEKVKVFNYKAPLKSIAINGKVLKDSTIKGNSGKVKINLEAGNSIKKLEYGVYKIEKENSSSFNNQSTKMVYKSFKNNEKIKFSNQPYYSLYESNNSYEGLIYEYKSFFTGFTAPTEIKITYKDKYTKKNEVISINLNKDLY